MAFSLGLLLLIIIPLPQFLFQGLSRQLQSISSTLGVTCLQVVGITVFQGGNVIDLGPIQLQGDSLPETEVCVPSDDLGFVMHVFSARSSVKTHFPIFAKNTSCDSSEWVSHCDDWGVNGVVGKKTQQAGLYI